MELKTRNKDIFCPYDHSIKDLLFDMEISTMHGSVWEAEQKWISFDKDDLSTCCIHIKVT